jgi:DNA mismatch endonuclease (patch repair protein)
MTDRIIKKHRSWNMSRIRSKNTSPELWVRSLLHNLGYRFRIHRNDLPGTPDIVLPRYRVAVLVHGCFWHRHPGCKYAYTPKTRIQFWRQKFAANIKRDRTNQDALKTAGWRLIIVWECELKNPESLSASLVRGLNLSNGEE